VCVCVCVCVCVYVCVVCPCLCLCLCLCLCDVRCAVCSVCPSQTVPTYTRARMQMEQEHESSFRQYAELLTKYSHRCAEVLEEIENAKGFLGVRLSQHPSLLPPSRSQSHAAHCCRVLLVVHSLNGTHAGPIIPPRLCSSAVTCIYLRRSTPLHLHVPCRNPPFAICSRDTRWRMTLTRARPARLHVLVSHHHRASSHSTSLPLARQTRCTTGVRSSCENRATWLRSTRASARGLVTSWSWLHCRKR
jgi:hypothetical protein